MGDIWHTKLLSHSAVSVPRAGWFIFHRICSSFWIHGTDSSSCGGDKTKKLL